MGDAGPPTPLFEEQTQTQTPAAEEQTREIHVLVTGFGPFKSFSVNPSWLIASSLPTKLSPLPASEPTEPVGQALQATPKHPYHPSSSTVKEAGGPQQDREVRVTQPLRPPNTRPYQIVLHTFPDPVRVAYTPTAALIPSLLNPATNPEHIDYDYILHIGLASGRDSYTLETLAHRESYLIPDVDDGTGDLVSDIWRRQSVPEVLHAGWHPTDVLARWEAEVSRRQAQPTGPRTEDTNDAAATTATTTATPQQGGVREWMASHGMLLRPSSQLPPAAAACQTKKAVVRLSRDAGRFLCEFILMCSLTDRYLAAQPRPPGTWPAPAESQASEKQGKVAFLHVPNGTDEADVARGRMVAESAIRSLVASWEEGYRNPIVYKVAAEASEDNLQVSEETVVSVSTSGFEHKATGDAVPS